MEAGFGVRIGTSDPLARNHPEVVRKDYGTGLRGFRGDVDRLREAVGYLSRSLIRRC